MTCIRSSIPISDENAVLQRILNATIIRQTVSFVLLYNTGECSFNGYPDFLTCSDLWWSSVVKCKNPSSCTIGELKEDKVNNALMYVAITKCMDTYVLIASLDDTHANEDRLGTVKYKYVQDTVPCSLQELEGKKYFSLSALPSKSIRREVSNAQHCIQNVCGKSCAWNAGRPFPIVLHYTNVAEHVYGNY